MDYSFLLNKEDSVKKLHGSTLIDVKDYLYMREKMLPSTVKYDKIKSIIITNSGETLWHIVEKFLNSEFRPIGVLDPPISLIKWVVNNNSNQ